jgi:hypothetical protein
MAERRSAYQQQMSIMAKLAKMSISGVMALISRK